MSATVFQLPDPNVSLLDLATAAKGAGLHLIHNGRDIVVSPIIPPGWQKVGVIVRQPAMPKEGALCAA